MKRANSSFADLEYEKKQHQKLRRFFRKARNSALLLFLIFVLCRTGAAQPPNIIFLLTDDMGYGDVACYGGNFVPTPNIDQLAKEGTQVHAILRGLRRYAHRRGWAI